MKKNIAITGGGPAGLFMYKHLIRYGDANMSIHIFEASTQLGCGMPYSHRGAEKEHITNVSGNEIAVPVTPVLEWIKSLPEQDLRRYNIDKNGFNEYKVFPRLLFGEYLQYQFGLLLEKGKQQGIDTVIHLGQRVTDIKDDGTACMLYTEANDSLLPRFDHVIVCTGHVWKSIKEGSVPGYFDSPYPPSKLSGCRNLPVAIKGSGLTAIDAVRTIARQNGKFIEEAPHRLRFVRHPDAVNFSIVMYSLKGLLPGIRFHLDDPRLSADSLLTNEDIQKHMAANDGFLSLDFIFENDFKIPLRSKDPAFYETIKDMGMEEMVDAIMSRREKADPFALFKAEYAEAKQSIEQKESVHWKEMLAVLSFAMNYPAKHFSAEDMQRLQHTLMPLISIVIAFVPQSSCEELIALHDAGLLSLIAVEKDSHVDVSPDNHIVYHHTDEEGNAHQQHYPFYIDCTGQKHLWIHDFPFKSLVQQGSVVQARLPFRSASCGEAMMLAGSKEVSRDDNSNYCLDVPGIAISDNFNAIDTEGKANPRLYMMAVPFIGGHNPDYSGLDFCEEAAGRIADAIAGA